MGITKNNLFTQKQNEMAMVAKVFAHPARVAIIEYLLEAEKCVNGKLVEELGLAQATISQHLRELKNTGIIQGNIEGVSVCYCINPERWQEIKEMFYAMFESYKAPAFKKNC